MPDNWQRIVSGADFENHGGGGLSYCTHTHPWGGVDMPFEIYELWPT